MVEFKRATLTEANELAKVKFSAWSTTYRGIYPDELIDKYDYEMHTEKFVKTINNSEIDLYCVYEDGVMVGFFSFGYNIREYKHFKIYLKQLYLVKQMQGKGVGRMIFDFIRQELRKKGEVDFFCNCNVYNTSSIKFYEKMGGVVTDTVINPEEDKSYHQVYIEFEV